MANTVPPDNRVGEDSGHLSDHTNLSDLISTVSKGRLLRTDYGAVGDGSTDDTAAVQAALDEAYEDGGGVVVFEPGHTYQMGGTIRPRDNTHIIAYGATIWGTTDWSAPILNNWLNAEDVSSGLPGFTGHSNITVEGGIWDMKGYAAPLGNGTEPYVHNTFQFSHCRNVTVRNVIFRNSTGAHACEFHAVEAGHVYDCRFEGYTLNDSVEPREFIQIDCIGMDFDDGTVCNDIWVEGNYFGPSPVDGEGGLPARAVGGHSHDSATNYTNIRVIGNYVAGTLDRAIGPFNWNDSIIANNIITGVPSGFYAVYASAASASGRNNIGLVVSNNVIHDCFGGIQLFTPDNGTTAWEQVAIVGNTIRTVTTNAIVLTGDHITCVGNTINRSSGTGYGIQCGNGSAGPLANAVVSGNHIDVTGVTSAVGMRVNDATYTLITGNKIKGTTGISPASTNTGTIIVGNDLSQTSTKFAATDTAIKYSYAGSTTQPGDNL